MDEIHGAVMPAAGRKEQGFALLITVILLAFLVLLLVSLAALTRVETQVASNHQNLEQARQNALMALNIAIGQLQKYAGPDARITAESAIISTTPILNPHYAGVWGVKSDSTVNMVPDMWLVSGSEQSGATSVGMLEAGLDPSNDTVAADQVFLVGNHSVAVDATSPTATEKTRRVKLTKQDIKVDAGSVPGLAVGATPVVGRYAWWVGDQGVKASLALPDRADEVTYAPWDTQTQRRRIRQQIGSGPNYFRGSSATTASTKEGFDPFIVGAMLNNVRLDTQLGHLTPAAGSMADFVHGHYHDFTTAAYGILANTLPAADTNRGLMHDLSLNSSELGAAYVAYANYANYMEAPGTTVDGATNALPAIMDADSPRRRYQISIPVSNADTDLVPNLIFDVVPVITEMLVQFSVEYSAGYKVGMKIYMGLWNPYTSAIVPPNDLSISIRGFPQITLANPSGSTTASVDLQADLPAPIKDSASGAMRLYLPFVASSQADTLSWLPGRIYGWTTKSSSDGGIDEKLKFYNKDMGSIQRWYYATGPLAGGSTGISVTVPAVPSLTIELRNASGLLATYTTPAYSGYSIPASTSTKWFAYAFRLKQASNTNKDRTWLKTFDPRASVLPTTALGGFDPNTDTIPLDPSAYITSSPVTKQPGYLIYRIQGTSGLALSSYNDPVLFELPRLPLLSLGELQQMQVKDSRPFAIGNSWGGAANAIFDRFFFSGLPATVSAATGVPDLNAGQPLPNWNLRVVGTTDVSTVRTAAAFSSQYLLQAGGFNLNSTSVSAWRAILSSVRFNQDFLSADIENSSTSSNVLGTQKTSTATAPDRFNADATLGAGVSAPTFFRFSQSAQETHFWNVPSGSSVDARTFETPAFRLGVRGSDDQTLAASSVSSSVTIQHLTTDQVEALADAIVTLIKTRAAASGPFRSMQEFLGPLLGSGTPSLLETAIETAGINPASIKPLDTVSSLTDPGFSSLTLTQADIMTALAPFLRARSDTFTIRSYGESSNPVTNEASGKAWLEATVQRFPETVNAADNVAQPAGSFGRRFKIISFRWLSSTDI